MRLLDTTSYKLKEFIGDDIPEYAILSHTWQDDEVLFRHVEDGTATTHKGWDKVARCCDQARQDGWTYVWIDACCIDKASSAELSEAINSMYQWYRNSMVCYAYLNDIDVDCDGDELQDFRWFRRGWTLQELLAPTQLFFYDEFWREIGTKFTMAAVIRRSTGINETDLIHPRDASVARNMFWASQRKTTRAEDVAYRLLGLFDVNMPLLYGEGRLKAFLRLQYEILAKSNDDSIFAWQRSTVFSVDPSISSRSCCVLCIRKYYQKPYSKRSWSSQICYGHQCRSQNGRHDDAADRATH